MKKPKQYLVKMWSCVEPSVHPVKGTIKQSLRRLIKDDGLTDEDVVFLATVTENMELEVQAFSGGYMEKFRKGS